jgi:hypothetical protein
MTDEQIQRIVSRLNGSDQGDAFAAAKAIFEDTGRRAEAGRTADKRLERPLIATLKKGRRTFNRAVAAFAIQMVSTPKTLRALECVIKNKSERPRVRGGAAEALAHCHRREIPRRSSCRTERFKQGRAVLVCILPWRDGRDTGTSLAQAPRRHRQKGRKRLSLSCEGGH